MFLSATCTQCHAKAGFFARLWSWVKVRGTASKYWYCPACWQVLVERGGLDNDRLMDSSYRDQKIADLSAVCTFATEYYRKAGNQLAIELIDAIRTNISFILTWWFPTPERLTVKLVDDTPETYDLFKWYAGMMLRSAWSGFFLLNRPPEPVGGVELLRQGKAATEIMIQFMGLREHLGPGMSEAELLALPNPIRQAVQMLMSIATPATSSTDLPEKLATQNQTTAQPVAPQTNPRAAPPARASFPSYETADPQPGVTPKQKQQVDLSDEETALVKKYGWDNLAKAAGDLADAGRYEESFKCSLITVKALPGEASGWLTCGLALYQMDESVWRKQIPGIAPQQNAEKSLTYFDKAIELDGGNHLAWYFKGMCLSQLGQIGMNKPKVKSGLDCLDKALQLSGGKPAILQAKRQIEMLYGML
ncbi:MAG: hypothetical protein HY289_13195 [Planctomycetes bacterium]|nr:hypothetical protein [Planctomycetota bacterium]